MARGHALHRVRLVEDHEVVLEEDAAFARLVVRAEQREEERVVHHQHVRAKDALADALEETDAVVLGEVRLRPADLRRTQPAFAAHVLPDLRIGFDGEVRQAAVLRLLGPFPDALQLGCLGRGEEAVGLERGLVEPAGAEVVLPALQHGVAELHRQHRRKHRQILLRELLLEVDRVGGDDGLLALGHGEKDRRDQVGQTLADARAGLDDEMPPALQRPGHFDGHLVLLRAELEVARPRQEARRRKDLRHLRDKRRVAPGRRRFGEINHGSRPVGFGARGLLPETPGKTTGGGSSSAKGAKEREEGNR